MDILVIILMLIGFISYFIAIENDSSNINLATFTLWTIVGLVIMVSKYFSDTDNIERIQGVLFFIGPLLVTILVYFRGSKYSDMDRSEILCMIIAAILLIIYISLELSPLKDVALLENGLTLLLIILDFIVAFPLLQEIKKNPISEKVYPWLLWTLGNLCALIAIPDHTFVGSFFILYVMLLCLTVTLYISYQQIKYLN